MLQPFVIYLGKVKFGVLYLFAQAILCSVLGVFTRTSYGALSPGANQRQTAAIQTYLSGDAQEATGELERLFADEKGRLSIRDARNLVLLILDLCRNVGDINCAIRYTDVLLSLTDENADENATKFDQQWNSYQVLANGLFAPDIKPYRELLQKGVLRRFDPWLDPILFVRAQLVGAHLYLRDNEPKKARELLDKAIAILLTHHHRYPYDVARVLNEILQLLISTGDVVRAYSLYLVSADFLAQSLAHSKIDSALFRYTEGTILEFNNAPSVPLAAFTEAKKLLPKLVMPKPIQKYLLREVNLNIAALCILDANLACAHEALNDFSGARDRKSFVRAGRFVSPQALAFATADTLLRTLENVPPEDTWQFAFDSPPGGTLTYRGRQLFESYRYFGRALYNLDETGHANVKDLLQAGRSRISLFLSDLESGSDGFPLSDLFGRVIIQAALVALARKNELAPSDADLALQLMELANRSLRQTDVEVLVALSATNDKDVRRAVHAKFRLASRQYQIERKRMKELIEALRKSAAPSTRPLEKGTDYFTLRQLADFGIKRHQIERRLEAKPAFQSKRLEFPTVRRLQSVLHSDEAFVSVTGAIDSVVQLCITKDTVQIGRSQLDRKQILIDSKLLVAALTASHPASEVLDAQFPLKAAGRLFDLNLGQIRPCWKSVAKIIWSPPAGMVPIPPTIFYDTEQASDIREEDLASVPWLIRKHAFAYALSARGFVASRELKHFPATREFFLGVGDPVLSGSTIDGLSRTDAVLTRSAPVNGMSLHDLPELPETGEELEAIAQLFPKSAHLLLRNNATEERFRRELVRGGRVIEFATHGLISQDIPGLVEPALVLSPEYGHFELDDGLLTASEIANLNLSADLVVLSACNTANFRVELIGSEVQALTTAFAIAGSPTILATLWPVESSTSKRIIVDVFKELLSNSDSGPSLALRNSINRFLEDPPRKAFLHPRFWSPFVVFGDGFRPIQNREQGTHRFGLSHLEIDETSHGGEILAVRRRTDGRTYVAGSYRLHDSFYSSYLAEIDLSGKTQWRDEERSLGATPALMLMDDGILSASYGKNKDGRFIPAIRKVSKDGRQIWRKYISLEQGNGFPFAAARSKTDDTAIVGFLATSFEKGNTVPDQIMLVKIDPKTGAELARKVILPPSTANWVNNLIAIDDRLILTVTRRFGENLKNLTSFPRDEYGIYDACPNDAATFIYVIDSTTLETIDHRAYADVIIRGMHRTHDGHIVAAATKREGCAEGSAMVIALDKDGGGRIVFQDRTPFETVGVDVVDGPNGGLFLVGTGDRSFNIKRQEKHDKSYYENTERYLRDLEISGKRQGVFSLSDVFILQLSDSGTMTSRRWLQSGTNITVSDAENTPNGLIFGGQIGDKVMWGVVER